MFGSLQRARKWTGDATMMVRQDPSASFYAFTCTSFIPTWLAGKLGVNLKAPILRCNQALKHAVPLSGMWMTVLWPVGQSEQASTQAIAQASEDSISDVFQRALAVASYDSKTKQKLPAIVVLTDGLMARLHLPIFLQSLESVGISGQVVIFNLDKQAQVICPKVKIQNIRHAMSWLSIPSLAVSSLPDQSMLGPSSSNSVTFRLWSLLYLHNSKNEGLFYMKVSSTLCWSRLSQRRRKAQENGRDYPEAKANGLRFKICFWILIFLCVFWWSLISAQAVELQLLCIARLIFMSGSRTVESI